MLAIIQPYLAVLSARFRMLLQYRAAALAGMGTQIFWGWIRVMIFGAFYAASSQAQPLTWPQLVTYIWLGQAMFRLLPLGPDADVREMIRNGNVVYELARPIDLYALWYARSIAFYLSPTVLRSVPMFALALVLFGMDLPASPAAGAAWAACTVAALLLSAALATFVTITLMWTIAGDGVIAVFGAMLWLFSGMVVPLPLFPEWAQQILNWLPFRGLVDIPFRLYVGDIDPARTFSLLAFQLAWVGLLILAGRLLLTLGTRRLVVQGG